MQKNTDVIRIAILGAAGRMGQHLSQQFAEDSRFEVIARVDKTIKDDGMKPAITAHLNEAPDFDVLVDFSMPEATASALPEVRRRRCAWLVATTGLSDRLRTEILALSETCAIFTASNTSLGVAVMQHLCAKAAVALRDWDCEIIETHHHFKLDAPSGTALSIAGSIAEARQNVGLPSEIVTDRCSLREARRPEVIGISAVRGGTVAGEHSAIWFGENERFEIKHCAENRAIFANGARKIASWLAHKPAGHYNMPQMMQDIL